MNNKKISKEIVNDDAKKKSNQKSKENVTERIKNVTEALKKYYTDKAQSASEEIDNLDMSSEKSEIINKLIELYSLIQIYYLNKIDNNLKENENINNISIESDVMKLEKRLREMPKKGRGVFTSQKEFAKLLIFLAQLLTHNTAEPTALARNSKN